MEYEVPYRLILTILAIALIVWVVIKVFYHTPHYPRVDEGFYGGAARGAGQPDCLRTLPEGSQILDRLQSKGLSATDANYAELQLLMSKMACLKKDLMSPSGIPEATRYQAFETAHDRIAVAEMTGMCLSKNIPPRDLDIVFGTWRERGTMLLRMLCTEANLTDQESTDQETQFVKAWKDVYDVANSVCIASPSRGDQVDGGEAAAYDPPSHHTQRSYDQRYAGLSASGWNGAV